MSKRAVLIIIVLTVFLVAGYYFFRNRNISSLNNNQSLTPSPTFAQSPTGFSASAVPTSSSSVQEKLTPSQVANNYYTEYLSCLKSPPPSAIGQVSVYCQQHNSYAGKNSVLNLETGGVAKAGADPIICAQNPPQKFEVINSALISDNQSSAIVSESYATGNPVQIKVTLSQEDNLWKVENITCPSP